MNWRFSRRFFLWQQLSWIVAGCTSTPKPTGVLTIGVINYGGGKEIIQQFTRFNRLLGEKTKAHVRLEPTFNENKAIERLEAKAWSLVFAPPGIAAIAMTRHQYVSLFPLVGINNLRSVFVVRQDSPIQELKQLQGQTVALGQPGSATGYYFPIYNLFGLTLAEILFAPAPKTVLELVAEGKAAAGAVSLAEFNLHSPQVQAAKFRILHTDPHYVPPGVVLIGPTIERNRQEFIRKIMNDFPSTLAQEVGYVPNAKIPDYQYMISIVERVRAIATNVQNKPARIF
jgi:phosphonate transport system substrate-binding protein